MTGIDDRLLQAAAEVFAERGYAGAGVAEIARRAGVTTGAIYSRYRGKADLLVEALDGRMAAYLESALASSSGTDAPGILSALGSHLLADEGHHHDGLLVEAVVAARHELELAAMLERRLAAERSRLGKVIDEAKAIGLFDPALDGEAVVTFIQAVGLGFVLFRTIGTPMPDPAAWQVVIDRLIAAALPPADPPAPETPARDVAHQARDLPRQESQP